MNQPAKTNEQWPADLRAVREQYESLGDDALIDALRQRFELTVENLRHMAVLIRLADERGVDLGPVEHLSILPALRRVAYGQVLPEVVHKFLGARTLFDRVTALPLNQQERLARDEPVEVAQRDLDSGEITHRLLPPSRLNTEQIRQVFASDRVRDIGEQRTWIEHRERRQRGGVEAKAGPYVLDARRRVVRFTQPCELSVHELNKLVSQLLIPASRKR